ncbi:cytochrome P450 [Myxococcota bacterium]|nr:cytochrome P450 [Myxococcota bacterium]
MNLDPIPQVPTDDPFPLYDVLREEHPMLRVEERDLWVASRYTDVRAMLENPDVWSSAHGVVPSRFKPDKPTIIAMDAPRHTVLRKSVSRAFTPRRIDVLSKRIREIARELIDEFPASGEFDVFHAFTDPLPMYVMAALLGVGREERAMFKRCGDAIVYASDTPPDELHAAQSELTDYLAVVFEERRREPREDLISVLVSDSPEGKALDEEEMLGLCFLLLVAGTETTTSALGNGLLLLDRFRAERDWVAADPARVHAASEEVLRFDPPVHGLSRVASRDTEVHGVPVSEGEWVHMLFAAANRDPRTFENPERFDPARTRNHHVSFGWGVHFCLGANLARMELRIGLQELLARMPNYRVVTDGVERLRSDTNRGFARLPVEI